MRILSAALFALFLVSTPAFADKPTFLGTWETNWGLLVIEEADDKLTGKYTGKFSGTIQGAVKEGKLHFTWKQPNAEWGSGVFSLSEDGSKLVGTWGGAKSETNGGKWTGKRSKTSAVK